MIEFLVEAAVVLLILVAAETAIRISFRVWRASLIVDCDLRFDS